MGPMAAPQRPLRGDVEPGPPGRGVDRRRLFGIVTLLLLAALAAVAVRSAGRSGGDRVSAQAPSEGPSGPSQLSVDGSPPAELVADPLRVGPVALDDPIEDVLEVLGPPASTEPDLFGTAHVWPLPGGAELVVTAWDEEPRTVSGVTATVPDGSPVRISVGHEVVLGEATLADVVARWGPTEVPAEEGSDHVALYTSCIGPAPVVVKFDQEAAGAPGGARAPAPDRPVTRVLVAYADEPFGSCPG